MRTRTKVLLGVLVVLVVILSCINIQRAVVQLMTPDYEPSASLTEAEARGASLSARMDGLDAERPKIPVVLTPVLKGITHATDIQPVPGRKRELITLEKEGRARWHALDDGASKTLFEIPVIDASEEGLLGIAFHPEFTRNGRFFLNYNAKEGGSDVTRIAEWKATPPGAPLREAKLAEARVLLVVKQPYPNHDAGQLQFGPDRMLYVGFGDGGWANDPHGHGQDPMTALGEMLRIDVDTASAALPRQLSKAYSVPRDNPFVGKEGFLPEIWARGLRNPWRYSFDERGRLIAADVGQDTWEEIDILERGANYGWNVMEARHCFHPPEGCKQAGLTRPIYEYGRDDGSSVTGGYVALTGALRGKYVFGDFLSGRLWALDLPDSREGDAKVYALGRFPILPATFGRDLDGVLYVSDYKSGVIFRIDPAR